MERSSFFNSVNRDRRYKAEDFARYFASFIGNGVFPIPSNGLQVISNNNMTVTLKPGKAWINGYFYWNDNDLVLNIEPADGVLNRIDRVVIRLDYLKREIKTYVKKGNFASSPAAPTLVRNADMYELGIADIKVNKGAISISNANITDTRLNKSLCGIVHGVIEQIDPTELFNQYQLYLNEKINSNEFSDWLNSLKDKLDPNSDLAVQLQVQIDSLVSQVEEMNNKIENIDLSADKVILSNPNLKSTNVNDGLTELFTFADNGKKNWVDVIGSPLSKEDSFSTLKSKTQNLKNTFASNLNSKKVSASGTEDLSSLIDKIKNINTGLKYATGTFQLDINMDRLTIKNLSFKPFLVCGISDTYDKTYTPCFFYIEKNGIVIAQKRDSRYSGGDGYYPIYRGFGVNIYDDGFYANLNSRQGYFKARNITWLAIGE